MNKSNYFSKKTRIHVLLFLSDITRAIACNDFPPSIFFDPQRSKGLNPTPLKTASEVGVSLSYT